MCRPLKPASQLGRGAALDCTQYCEVCSPILLLVGQTWGVMRLAVLATTAVLLIRPADCTMRAKGADDDHDVGLAAGGSASGVQGIVELRNITYSCNASSLGPAPSYCVDSAMAQYLPLSGKHFGYDIEWEKFPEAHLWQLGDGLTFTDDIPICYHPPTVGAQKVNITSFIASIQHYKLASTFCSFGNLGNDVSTAGVAEWGYDWYATTSATQAVACAEQGRGSCKATTRRGAYECIRDYWHCRVSMLARGNHGIGAMSAMLGHYLMHHYSATWSLLSVIGSEVGENINSIQAHFAFNRGAARQYHLPWFIEYDVSFGRARCVLSTFHACFSLHLLVCCNVTVVSCVWAGSFSDWNAGFLHSYTLNATSGIYPHNNSGHSISLRERVAYLTYMAGANKHKMEDPSLFLDNNQTTEDGFLPLSPVGESAQRTHAFFVTNPERGKPYAPIAIMINSFHGMGLGYSYS